MSESRINVFLKTNTELSILHFFAYWIIVMMLSFLPFCHNNCKQIHLCCGDQSLGSCEVPWSSILRPSSDAINRQPLLIEGSFHLIPPLRARGAIPPGDNTACVGASVVLRREEIPIQPVIPKVCEQAPSQHNFQYKCLNGTENSSKVFLCLEVCIYLVLTPSYSAQCTYMHLSCLLFWESKCTQRN